MEPDVIRSEQRGSVQMLDMSHDEYVRQVIETGGEVLQLSTIGCFSLVTSFRSLGVFESYLWDDRDQSRGAKGELLDSPQSLEMAHGVHYAYSQALWRSSAGRTARKHAKELLVDIKDLI